jgi:hypothetical protein
MYLTARRRAKLKVITCSISMLIILERKQINVIIQKYKMQNLNL